MRAAGGGRGLPVAVLTALLLTACSGTAARGPAGTPVPPPAPGGQGAVGAAATTTPAAELRAGLTWLLVERVQLLVEGREAVSDGDGPRLRAVRDRLVEVGDDLAREVGSRPLPLRAALQAEVDAALAPQLQVQALSAAHGDTADVLAGQTPQVAVDRLRTALDRSTSSLTGEPPRADPRAAAAAAGLVANALAAQRRLGSTETSAVVLRSELTMLLVARAWLVGDPARADALDVLAQALAARVGDPQADALLVPLRAGHAALLAASRAARTGDAVGAARARTALAAADRDLADRLARVVPTLPVALLRRELEPAQAPLLAAVSARARGEDDAPALSSASARRAVVTAAVVAAAVADERRLS